MKAFLKSLLKSLWKSHLAGTMGPPGRDNGTARLGQWEFVINYYSLLSIH